MSYERIMGIHINNDKEYQKYRQVMMPILNSFGGSFGFDFKIAEVLISKTNDEINRVFTIEFPNKQMMEDFFSDPEYLAAKKRHFNNSVSSITLISLHEK